MLWQWCRIVYGHGDDYVVRDGEIGTRDQESSGTDKGQSFSTFIGGKVHGE